MSIGKVIDAVPSQIPGVEKKDVLVVDDGSTDKSAQVAKEHGAIVVSHPFNMGVGAAFNTGISEAIKLGAEVAVNIDADGQFDPADIPTLVAPIIQGRADFVTASRFKDKSLVPEMPKVKKWGNRRIANLINVLTGQKFYDVSCGFRAYSRETLLNLNLIGKFTYTQETFLDLAFKDMKIVEIPIQVKGEREFGQSRVAGNLWTYALNTARIIFKSFRDYKPFRFFGFIALVLFLISLGQGGFFFSHYFRTGSFSGHLWAGFSSGFLLLFSILFFVTGLLADMFDRVRQNQEKLLYFERRKMYENSLNYKNKNGLKSWFDQIPSYVKGNLDNAV